MDKEFYILKSIRNIQESEKLNLNFGNKNNLNLFIQYGLSHPANPYEWVRLKIDLFNYPEVIEATDLKRQILKQYFDEFDADVLLI